MLARVVRIQGHVNLNSNKKDITVVHTVVVIFIFLVVNNMRGDVEIISESRLENVNPPSHGFSCQAIRALVTMTSSSPPIVPVSRRSRISSMFFVFLII